jgi:hypothetical protein
MRSWPAPLQVGDTMVGTVVSIRPYGAYIDLGTELGLVLNEEMYSHKGLVVGSQVQVGFLVPVQLPECCCCCTMLCPLSAHQLLCVTARWGRHC